LIYLILPASSQDAINASQQVACDATPRIRNRAEEMMTYRTVMVSLAVDQDNARLLDVAAQVAKHFASNVIGVAAADYSPPLYYASGAQAEKLEALSSEAIQNKTEELEHEFRASMQDVTGAVEWRAAQDIPARYVASQARAADLVISAGGGAISDPFTVPDPADLVMQVGRPLLVVPALNGRVDLTSVLVAWKDNPEARRVLAAALPLLKHAREVKVVQVVEDDLGRDQAQAALADVVGWLKRHEVAASGLVPDQVGNVVLQLDRLAATMEAGVIVAGAYGHSRFREWILGGVTQYLVTQTSRCALLTH
jgi:nucleotide-binding universal stress UspA family protein